MRVLVRICVRLLDGKYSKSAKAGESKAMYATMLAIRSGIVAGAGTLASLLVRRAPFRKGSV